MTEKEARNLLPMTVVYKQELPDRLGTVVMVGWEKLIINWDDGTQEILSYWNVKNIKIK